MESAYSILAQALAGLNLIHDVGYLDMGMVCSAEMLVLGDEVIGMVKRFLEGIKITPDTLAENIVEKVGPGGHFIQEHHTYQHFRKELWMPSLLTRKHYTEWQKEGAEDIGDRVKEKIRKILEIHQVQPIREDILEELGRLRADGEKELLNVK